MVIRQYVQKFIIIIVIIIILFYSQLEICLIMSKKII